MAAISIRVGGRVRWGAGGLDGYVDRIEGQTAHVVFDDGSDQLFSLKAGVLEATPFGIGARVMRADGTVGVVLEEVPSQDYPTLKVAFADGSLSNAVELTLRPATLDDPIERFRADQVGTAEQFNLRSVTADLWTRHLHDSLVSLSFARVDLQPHQVSVVHRVISSYPHRFLLSDEVGLGKTIEAAMIVKELRARGLARRVLILVPSGLVRQWQFELKTKFNETFAIFDNNTLQYLRSKGVSNPWTDHDSVIASQAWASWTPERRDEIAAVDWDLVIVDEAHHARRQRQGSRVSMTNLYRLVSELTSRPEFSRRGVLFLTATPLQLQRHELFSLVEMLNPILFASEDDFVEHVKDLGGLNQLVEELTRSGVDADLLDRASVLLGEDAATLADLPAAELSSRLRARHRLSEVLIRNRRAVIGGFLPRSAFRWEVEITDAERAVQAEMDSIISEGYREAERTRQTSVGFLMVIWQKLAASSSRALLKSLEGRRERLLEGETTATLSAADAEEDLSADTEASEVTERLGIASAHEVARIGRVIELLKGIDIDSKARTFVEKLRELFDAEPEGKVIVFTEFRETQDMLSELIAAQGWSAHRFHGQLNPLQKDDAIENFRVGQGPQVLVSTEAGGEGRNFQFAHILVNYDLPWNPMRVEQRIGRVDRIGQEHPVTIFNFHVQGTIEGRILDVLERRIRLFEESVGGLDPILGDAETNIRAALRSTVEERDRELERVGKALENRVLQARNAEVQLRDFILDTKSYSAEIAQTALQEKQSVSQADFERLINGLLRSVNTWVEPNRDHLEREIYFHPPFTEEHKELVDGREKRRVCFDPRTFVDSEHVEYLGFGHPIIDAIVKRTIEERHDGATAIRQLREGSFEGLRPGWQFNWLIKVGGLKPREFVHSVFVDDHGVTDKALGAALLERSRSFDREETDRVLDTTTLDDAYQHAHREVGQLRDALMVDLHEESQSRFEIERDRIERLYANREEAAGDRIEACSATLERLSASDQPMQRQAIPLWEANLERARGELESLGQDKARALRDLTAARMPQAEYRLLAAARIEVTPTLAF